MKEIFIDPDLVGVCSLRCDWKYVSIGQGTIHDDVIKWKHFPRNWPFVRGIHRSPVNSPHKGQWRGALMFSLICVWINYWVNNREAGDLSPPLWRHCNVEPKWKMTLSSTVSMSSLDVKMRKISNKKIWNKNRLHSIWIISINITPVIPEIFMYVILVCYKTFDSFIMLCLPSDTCSR